MRLELIWNNRRILSPLCLPFHHFRICSMSFPRQEASVSVILIGATGIEPASPKASLTKPMLNSLSEWPTNNWRSLANKQGRALPYNFPTLAFARHGHS